MNKESIVVIVLIVSFFISGCDSDDAKKVLKLNKEIKELSSKLEEAEKTIGVLKNENIDLKKSLSSLNEKDKSNLDKLFR